MKEYIVYNPDDVYYGRMSMWDKIVDLLLSVGWTLIPVEKSKNYLDCKRGQDEEV